MEIYTKICRDDVTKVLTRYIIFKYLPILEVFFSNKIVTNATCGPANRKRSTHPTDDSIIKSLS